MKAIGYAEDNIYYSLDLNKILAFAEKQDDAEEIISDLKELQSEVAAGIHDPGDVCDEIWNIFGNTEAIFDFVTRGTVMKNVNDDVGNSYLVYTASFPWELLAEEKDLEEKDVREMLVETIKQITVDSFDAEGTLKIIDI